jgi:FMN phosphatase YigB (HAD superfamily)
MQKIINKAPGQEIETAVEELITQFCRSTVKRDGDWEAHLNGFMEAEKSDIRIQCAKHLAPDEDKPYNEGKGILRGGKRSRVVMSPHFVEVQQQLDAMDQAIEHFKANPPKEVVATREDRRRYQSKKTARKSDSPVRKTPTPPPSGATGVGLPQPQRTVEAEAVSQGAISAEMRAAFQNFLRSDFNFGGYTVDDINLAFNTGLLTDAFLRASEWNIDKQNQFEIMNRTLGEFKGSMHRDAYTVPVSKPASSIPDVQPQTVATKPVLRRQSSEEDRTRAFEKYGNSLYGKQLNVSYELRLTGDDYHRAKEAGLLNKAFVSLALESWSADQDIAFATFHTELLGLRLKGTEVKPAPQLKQVSVTTPPEKRTQLTDEAFKLFVGYIGDYRFGLTIADTALALEEGLLTDDVINACLNPRVDVDDPMLNQFGQRLHELKYQPAIQEPKEDSIGFAPDPDDLPEPVSMNFMHSYEEAYDSGDEWDNWEQSLNIMSLQQPMALRQQDVLQAPVPVRNTPPAHLKYTPQQWQLFEVLMQQGDGLELADFEMALNEGFLRDEYFQSCVQQQSPQSRAFVYQEVVARKQLENFRASRQEQKQLFDHLAGTVREIEPQDFELVLRQGLLNDRRVFNCLYTKDKLQHQDYLIREIIDLKLANASVKPVVQVEAHVGREEARAALTPQKLQALKRELIDGGWIQQDNGYFEYLIENLHPEKVLSEVPLSLGQKIWCFGQLEQYSKPGQLEGVAKSRAFVNPEDIIMMINNDVLTGNDYVTLQNEPQTSSNVVIARVVKQYPELEMTGFGFTAWNNTCNFNMALQSLVRSVPEGVLSRMEQQQYRDPDKEFLCHSFCELAREGKAILSGRMPPRVMTDRQVKFFNACHQYAKAGKFIGEGNRAFSVDGINNMRQADAADLINTFMQSFELVTDPASKFHQQRVDVATYRGQQIMRVVEEERPPIPESCANTTPFNFLENPPQNVTMGDWMDAAYICPFADRNGQQVWETKDLPPGARGPVTLESHAKYVQRVDTKNFSVINMVLGHTGMDDLKRMSREALLNSKRELVMPVVDENNQFRMARMRLKTLGLHAATAGGSASGHYLQASFDEQGQCTIQDDFRSLPFERYREFWERDGKTAGNKEWKDFYGMVEDYNYNPTSCVYELVGYDPEPDHMKQTKPVMEPARRAVSRSQVVEAPRVERVSQRIERSKHLEDVLHHIAPGEPVVVCLDLDETLIVKDVRPNGRHERGQVNPDTAKILQDIRHKAGPGNAKIILLTANEEDSLKEKLTKTGLDRDLFDDAVCIKVQTGPLKTKGQGLHYYLDQSRFNARHVVMVDDTAGMLKSVEQASELRGIPCTSFHFYGAKPQIYRVDFANSRDMIPDISFNRFVELQQQADDLGWVSNNMTAVYINESAAMRRGFEAEKRQREGMGLDGSSYDWKRLKLPRGYRPPEHLGRPVISFQ